MTKERMICERHRTTCYPLSEDGSYHLKTGGVECWSSWEPVKPASPEDWKPYCYDEEHNICSLVGLVNEPPKCWKECPYRKRSD